MRESTAPVDPRDAPSALAAPFVASDSAHASGALRLEDVALALRFVGAAIIVLVGLELLARALTGAESLPLGLHGALLFLAHELGTNAVLAHAALTGPRPARGDAASVSILVAAWNEADGIVATLRSLLAQRDVALEILVGDDGSTDGTSSRVVEALGLAPQGDELVSPDGRVRLVVLEHGGKGATLEALRVRARHPVLVTVDADTVLGEGALAAIRAPFVDPRVEAAAGAVVVRGASNTLTRFQFGEYLKNTFVRRGYSALGVLEQVPGAFAALRASSLEAAGGFPTDSLTEDYEVAYRLYARAAREGRRIRIPTIPEARAYTDPPRTFVGFVRQRTRWFAGFLSTLHRFRHLVFAPSAGAFGVVRLPGKVVDAVLPFVGLASLVSLVGAIVDGVATRHLALSSLGVALFGVRLLGDALLYAAAITTHRRAAGRIDALEPRLATTWLHATLESLGYAWLKQLVVLRAYPFALAKVATWERSRD